MTKIGNEDLQDALERVQAKLAAKRACAMTALLEGDTDRAALEAQSVSGLDWLASALEERIKHSRSRSPDLLAISNTAPRRSTNPVVPFSDVRPPDLVFNGVSHDQD